PTVWFRNTWSWGEVHEESTSRPSIFQAAADRLVLEHETLGRFILAMGPGDNGGLPTLLFTDNDTNHARFPEVSLPARYSKDAFHERVIKGRRAAVNPKRTGTKAAAHYRYEVAPGERVTIRLRLFAEAEAPAGGWRAGFDELMETRCREADEYYATVVDPRLDEDGLRIARQAYAGLLWSKQFYYYAVEDWLSGDPELPFEAWASRREGRNREWTHLFTRNVLSMPDKWEYPWFAAWDLAFHMIPFAKIDPQFAKYQLTLLLREWYMHPNGQLPAYEFNFSDVNPPVHAWAAWRVYKISAPPGRRDREFLESVFQKLLLNFTWWVNRKDVLGKNLFSGGFLGLDNIGVFDRSKPLPTGGTLRQADATAWMAFYCSTMLAMALELAREGDRVRVPYEDMASKFFEHFIQITDSMNTHGGTGLWDEEDGFYYDQIQSDHEVIPLKTRSLVGLLPLIAVEVIEEDVIRSLPGFNRRFQWFVKHRQDLAQYITYCELEHHHRHRLLAIPSRDRLERVLRYLLDESEFLSPHGIRSLSRFHEREPYVVRAQDMEHRVEYLPGESNSGMFGGNSNWRGPVWFPVNYLLKEALERYHYFYGDSFQVECPTGSGNRMNLLEVARELDRRLASLFRRDESGSRPCFGGDTRFREHPHWRDLLWFHEYFHAETGRGLGASHQTGWTALVIRHLEDIARLRA
ncbi:MAG TPA: glucosidase, partial [Methylomirabilota bacterium]|nr:glucosidase [Methylomirabilota bacterium]